ncbi:probable aquaporin PIP2-6 [Magnolia sinica]|uniref:probable aquaporin PIP2-6 n=1 Tax=Magnolia sinica TaxID=86752 RepID=UPI0026597056|nr:probable aquaporin PIP2-6 [Magnolia sinica]
MWRAALTELVATATLMFILTSCIISCLDSDVADPKLLIPFIIFAVVFLFLMVTVPLSGGHMSPIFTFIAALKGVISLTRAATYVVAQCIGSIMGFIVVKCVMSHEEAAKYSLGGCTVVANGAAPGLGPSTALMLEFVCTFVVLFVGVTVAFDQRRCAQLGLTTVCAIVAGIMGLVVYVSVTITGQPAYAGVGLNPARCLGPAILLNGRLWEGHWVFWVGPFFGCIVYYGYSRNIPNGLVMGDGEFDFVNMVGRLIGR